jgi:hypothetical protein
MMQGMRGRGSPRRVGPPKKFGQLSTSQATGRATHLDERLDEVCAITWCLGRRL